MIYLKFCQPLLLRVTFLSPSSKPIDIRFRVFFRLRVAFNGSTPCSMYLRLCYQAVFTSTNINGSHPKHEIGDITTHSLLT